MPLVITLASLKGGSGKSMLSVQLAEALRLAGKRTVLVDLDPQATSRLFRDVAEETGHRDAVPVIGATGLGLRATLASLEGAADAMVLDTPPRLAAEARAAIAMASIVLVPVSPGPADVWALNATATAIDEVRATRADGGPKALAVLNRTASRTAFGQALPDAVRGGGFEVAKATIGNRILFPEAMAVGQSVLTYEASSPAAEEVRALLNEVLEVLA